MKDGTLRTGWYSTEPPEELLGEYNHTVEWFYFSSTGEPVASKNEKLYASDLQKIKGNQYLFNKKRHTRIRYSKGLPGKYIFGILFRK